MKRLGVAAFLTFVFFTFAATVFAVEHQSADKNQIKQYFDEAFELVQENLQKLLVGIDNNDFGPFAGIGVELSSPGDSEAPRVVVFNVFWNRPADKAGLMKGDIVLSVNGKPVSSPEEMVKEVRGDNSVGRTVTLELDRKGTKVTVAMTTVLLREDHRTEAARLREMIAKEGEKILAEIRMVFAKAVEVGAEFKEDDPRVKSALDVLDRYDSWYAEKMKAINNLYEFK